MAYKLNNSTQLTAGSNESPSGAASVPGIHIPIQVEKRLGESGDSVDKDLKALSINELVLNLVNNTSNICRIEQNLSGDQVLTDTNLKLLKLIDSINRNSEFCQQTATANANTLNTNLFEADETGGLSEAVGEHILSDLKAKKQMASNWNQKIAIELVECKIRLKQLINEM